MGHHNILNSVLSSIGHHAPSYSEHDTCTRLTREVQYEIPSNVLARYASQPLFEKMNTDRAREIVANVKAMLES